MESREHWHRVILGVCNSKLAVLWQPISTRRHSTVRFIAVLIITFLQGKWWKESGEEMCRGGHKILYTLRDKGTFELSRSCENG